MAKRRRIDEAHHTGNCVCRSKVFKRNSSAKTFHRWINLDPVVSNRERAIQQNQMDIEIKLEW
jgi:hypothetical protein